MLVKDQIIKSLNQVFEPGQVSAGRVYKGYDYDGTIQASGWWFKPFASQGIFLGRNKAEALETIEQIGIKGE